MTVDEMLSNGTEKMEKAINALKKEKGICFNQNR